MNYIFYLYEILQNILITSALFYSGYILVNPQARNKTVVNRLIKIAGAYIVFHAGLFYAYYKYA